MNDRDGGGPKSAAQHGRALEADADIGFGRPPKRTRFQPGRSGNPRGRPRGARGRAKIIEEIAGEMHVVVENGKRRRRSTLELVLLTLRNAAFNNNKALRALDELLGRYGPQEPNGKGGYLVVPEQLTMSEWLAKYGRKVGES